jgi:hypothetical protein
MMEMYRAIHTNDRRNSPAGHWINEAFIVRLWAILDSHHFVQPIDRTVEGWEMVDICRRLRHEIAHATGHVRDKEQTKLQAKMQEVFELGDQESIFEDKFILSKDKVLRPMYVACITYCKEILARISAQTDLQSDSPASSHERHEVA